jgi:hypothetical protein
VIVGSGLLFDSIQAIVRIWNENYTTGLSSLTSLLLVYALILILSVTAVIVGERFNKN